MRRRRDTRRDYVCHVLSVRFIRLQRDLSRNTGEHTEAGRRARAKREERGWWRDQVNPGHVEPDARPGPTSATLHEL